MNTFETKPFFSFNEPSVNIINIEKPLKGLMGEKKQTYPQVSDTISASEIGQYHYCSMSWYLQKCGYEPKSEMLNVGKQKHVELGQTIDNIQANARKSRICKITAGLLFSIAFLVFIFEVIL